MPKAFKVFMKNYLKIFCVTFAIQIIMLGLGIFSGGTLKYGIRTTVILAVMGYFCSLAADIYMSVKLSAPRYQKLICVFLMPSNYTPLLLFWAAMQAVIKFFEILPKDLG